MGAAVSVLHESEYEAAQAILKGLKKRCEKYAGEVETAYDRLKTHERQIADGELETVREVQAFLLDDIGLPDDPEKAAAQLKLYIVSCRTYVWRLRRDAHREYNSAAGVNYKALGAALAVEELLTCLPKEAYKDEVV